MKNFLLFVVMLMALFSGVSFAGSAVHAHHKTSALANDVQPHDMSVNLRVYVPQLFVGYVGGVWDIAISKTISFGPILRVFVAGKYDGYDFGLNMNYSLSGNLFKNGFILNPYIEYYNSNYEQPLNKFGGRPKVSTVVGGINLMYQFIWSNGFNIMLGGGLEYAGEKIPVTRIGEGEVHGHYDVTIGYAF